MNDIRKAKTKRHIEKLQAMKSRSGGKFNPPEWIFDENRYEQGCLSPQEMQEWAECVCGTMRSSVALRYQIECNERWGMSNGHHVFKDGNVTLEVNEALLENILIKYVESPILGEKPDELYIAVFHFYQRTEEERGEGKGWFSQFFDGMFIDLASDIRKGKKPGIKPAIH